MTGRAGRAGLDTHGESFLMVKQNQVKLVEDVVTSPVEHCISTLHKSDSAGLATLVLNCMFLGLVNSLSQVLRTPHGGLTRKTGRCPLRTCNI